jgi:hypothetical protein
MDNKILLMIEIAKGLLYSFIGDNFTLLFS